MSKSVYFDNGSEFLTHDIGGRGHRTRKTWNADDIPPTIFDMVFKCAECTLNRLCLSVSDNCIVHCNVKQLQYSRRYIVCIPCLSCVLVGWNLTEQPDSHSTLLALRHAIKRFGVPKSVYFDNGSEFLTHDIGGRGHRARCKRRCA